MRAADLDDLTRMRTALFFEGPDISRRYSRFWVLLILAAVIAAAGVVADSTATVIGAMIVAPLMTPILGTMLAVVLGDRTNLLRSVLMVLAGAAAAIAIGYLLGKGVANPVIAATNGQVAARVTPRLIDLVAALATGVVGSVALVRSDISDTLPGVAIAISLVPPLTVVGLAAEGGEWGESVGALLLFATNVAAILFTGIVVMALYRVHRLALTEDPQHKRLNRRNAILVIAAFVIVILVPLVVSTVKIGRDTAREAEVRRIAVEWGDAVGWDVVQVTSSDTGVNVVFAGPPPIPDTDDLADDIDAASIRGEVTVEFVPKDEITLSDD